MKAKIHLESHRSKQKNEPKTIFFFFSQTSGAVILRYFEHGIIINNKKFKSNCNFAFVPALDKQIQAQKTPKFFIIMLDRIFLQIFALSNII